MMNTLTAATTATTLEDATAALKAAYQTAVIEDVTGRRSKAGHDGGYDGGYVAGLAAALRAVGVPANAVARLQADAVWAAAAPALATSAMRAA